MSQPTATARRPRFSMNYRVLAGKILDVMFYRPLPGAAYFTHKEVMLALEDAILKGRIQGLEFAYRFGPVESNIKPRHLIRRVLNDSVTAKPEGKNAFLETDSQHIQRNCQIRKKSAC